MDRYFFQWDLYKRKNPDKTELDFVKEMIGRYKEVDQKYKKQLELNNLSDSELLEYIKEVNFKKYNEEGGDYFDEASILECFREENRRRKYNVSSIPLRYFEMQLNKINQNKPVKHDIDESLTDLSDTKLTEKIIMLHKLGVLDFLKTTKPFNVSTNALASAISGITGGKPETIQSYINPIYSERTAQKNNPLKKQKTVEKVEQKLILIGYKPNQ